FFFEKMEDKLKDNLSLNIVNRIYKFKYGQIYQQYIINREFKAAKKFKNQYHINIFTSLKDLVIHVIKRYSIALKKRTLSYEEMLVELERGMNY
ncbi:TPA: hypothetical protein ACKEXT_002931, partial [Enterococcus faecium]|nr:hypothetical protein [Enterococcus faecium]HBM4413557.1 hypothetical protein [Enterococcus faecium]